MNAISLITGLLFFGFSVAGLAETKGDLLASYKGTISSPSPLANQNCEVRIFQSLDRSRDLIQELVLLPGTDQEFRRDIKISKRRFEKGNDKLVNKDWYQKRFRLQTFETEVRQQQTKISIKMTTTLSTSDVFPHDTIVYRSQHICQAEKVN